MKQCAPPRWAEAMLTLLVPPACREEVMGDLHERCTGAAAYLRDALITVPMVIAGRIRRTTPPRMALMEACILYVSYVGAARYVAPALLEGEWGLMRAAVLAASALVGILLADAYSFSHKSPGWTALRGPLWGMALAWLVHTALAATHSVLQLPGWMLIYGSAAAVPWLAAVRVLLPPLPGAKPGR